MDKRITNTIEQIIKEYKRTLSVNHTVEKFLPVIEGITRPIEVIERYTTRRQVTYEAIPKSAQIAALYYVIEQVFDVDRHQLADKSRPNDLVIARRAFYNLGRRHLYLTVKRLGELTHRDHSTVVSSTDKFVDLMNEPESSFREDYNECVSLLNQRLYELSIELKLPKVTTKSDHHYRGEFKRTFCEKCGHSSLEVTR